MHSRFREHGDDIAAPAAASAGLVRPGTATRADLSKKVGTNVGFIRYG
jgi:hypothetical protein